MSAAAFRHPAEFDRRTKRLADRAGSGAMKASVRLSPCERLTAAIQGSPRLGQRPGMDRLGHGTFADRQPLRAAADQPAPDQSERGRADDAE